MPRYYTEEHEWIEVDGDVATVGITDFAQGQLGDIVFVEVPDTGAELSQGGDAAVVESVKAASDVYAPVDGTTKIAAAEAARLQAAADAAHEAMRERVAREGARLIGMADAAEADGRKAFV